MHIVNIMLSSGAGGIEQASADYCESLAARGHRVTAITHPDAVINESLESIGIEVRHLRNFGEWDVFAMMRMKRLLRELQPDIVITHTNRAYALMRLSRRICPLVGVAHNYNRRARRMKSANAVFAITRDVAAHLASLGVAQDRIIHIPNMIRCEALPSREPPHNPPVIGTMGRFVEKKGFSVFIDALALLHQRGYDFTAVIGGVGSEEKKLKSQAAATSLGDKLRFTGWVKDKTSFYRGVDIFCLPSLHEPFGIVLLEAFLHGVPVVATDTEGPLDIITDGDDALLAKKADAASLADGLARLLDNPVLAGNLAANAYVKVKTHYAMDVVGARIEAALQPLVDK